MFSINASLQLAKVPRLWMRAATQNQCNLYICWRTQRCRAPKFERNKPSRQSGTNTIPRWNTFPLGDAGSQTNVRISIGNRIDFDIRIAGELEGKPEPIGRAIFAVKPSETFANAVWVQSRTNRSTRMRRDTTEVEDATIIG